MEFANWEQLCKKRCPLCVKPLVGEPLQDLVYEGSIWMHSVCRQRELKQLAEAKRLAVLGQAINEYLYYRTNLESVF